MYDKIYYVKKPPQRKSKNLSFIKYIFLICIFLFTVNVFANIFIYSSLAKGSFLVSPLANDIIHKTVSFFNSKSNSVELEKLVLGILGKDSGNYGVMIKNLNTGERYYFNENKEFNTASLYKLWIMAVTYEQINKGGLKENEILTDSVEQINSRLNISSESAELTEGTVTHTVSNALKQMITISDNYSAYLLTGRIGLSNVSKFLLENGFEFSRVGTASSNPISTPFDMYLFFKKLYDGELSDKKTSEKMLSLLKNQKRNSKLPMQLPQETVIAHKTGELGGYSHDGGIVYTKKGNYIIVLMSKTNGTNTADKNIALISKGVFDYFTK